MVRTEVKTKDNYDLTTLLLDGFNTFELYRDEVERPFKELFTYQVSERVFQTDLRGDMEWDELAEGEHFGTGSMEREDEYMSVREYGRALNWNRHYIERHTREELNRELAELAQGYDKLEHERIMSHLFAGAADGTSIWFEPPDKGKYTFSKTHDHTFANTDELFVSDPYAPQDAGAAGTAHTPTEHIRRGNAHLRHHEKNPRVALCSSQFAEQFVDEVSWEASYYFPMAEGLRSRGLDEANSRVDGVTLMQTPWINDNGTDYTFYVVSDDQPIAMNEEAPLQMVENNSQAPIIRTDQLYDAQGYARVGWKVTDPLSIVKVTADNLA